MDRNELNQDEWNERELEEFERKLRFALQHRPAPMGLKQRVLAQARERRLPRHSGLWIFQRIAASAVLAAAYGGFAAYEQAEKRAEEQRKCEEARDQVMLALRITHKTLDRVGERLAESGR